MGWEKVFETEEGNLCVIAEMLGGFVQITEGDEQYVIITTQTLAGIAEAVRLRQYLKSTVLMLRWEVVVYGALPTDEDYLGSEQVIAHWLIEGCTEEEALLKAQEAIDDLHGVADWTMKEAGK